LGGSSCLLLSAGAASSVEIVATLATCHAQGGLGMRMGERRSCQVIRGSFPGKKKSKKKNTAA